MSDPDDRYEFFFVIGGQRCGTSLVRQQLDDHPNVQMARPFQPESRWFIDQPEDRAVPEFVRAHFTPDSRTRWLGEKATSYIEHPAAARRIRAALPRSRAIAVVRDPVERAISNYAYSVANGVEDRPIEVALSPTTPPRAWDRTRFSVSPYAYLERGRYIEYLRPWIDVFGEHLEVVLFDDVVAGRGVSEVLHWLGLVHDDVETRPPVVNAAPREGPVPCPALLADLRGLYESSNTELAQVFGLDLSRWTSADRVERG